MSTIAQIAANQTNAQSSTGPQTEAGKAASSQNNRKHGLIGTFQVTNDEDPEAFLELLNNLHEEHQTTTPTENMLVESMAKHFWLSQRATRFQDECLAATGIAEPGPSFALFLRYQTMHDRAFSTSLNNLLKLRAEKRKQEIGFERKKRQEAEEARKQEMHQARLRALQAKSVEQEFENEIRQTIEAPLPGHTRIPFEDMKAVITSAVRELAHEQQRKQAA